MVTGGAGFIGFHTAVKLLASNAGSVVVVDDFNTYYDVRLKIVSPTPHDVIAMLK